MAEIIVSLKLRPWQRPLVDYFRTCRKQGRQARASVVAHRRAGKDRAALFVELEEALRSPREVWHCLPEYAQARKVVWDARTGDGQRLIHAAFPPGIVRQTPSGRAYRDDEMKVELVNGSLWRLVGADNFNSVMGSNPRHVTFSEFALTSPRAREFVRPILAENGGSELTITTPRGYNHAFDHHEHLKTVRGAYTAIHPVGETKLIPEERLAEERRDMPDELYRQEYDCEFSAANVGAILGSRVERAEKEGRIGPGASHYDEAQPVILSSDIGFRDAAAWWFWQQRPDGYALVDYDEESGLDAEEWAERLREKDYTYAEVWMPHDAEAKTFATRRSAYEVFKSSGFNAHIVPLVSIPHRVNAARLAMPLCRFDSIGCKLGLSRLRQWSYEWDDVRRTFSKNPQHDEHSHGGDAFSYGALVMRKLKLAVPVKAQPKVASQSFTLDALYAAQHGKRDHYG